MKRLRRWLGSRDWAPGLLGVPVGLWLRLCSATTRWELRGTEEVEAALTDGPVILALWHERIALSGRHWRWGRISALHTTRFAGRVAGRAQAHLGADPIAVGRRDARAASREVLRRLKAGASVGIAVDGSSGPARQVRDPVLDWARATGRPVIVYAFAVRGQRRLHSWDRLVWPRPFSRGVAVWRRWEAPVPRRPDPATWESLRADLARALDAVAEEADQAVA